jgi:hypothetical protein
MKAWKTWKIWQYSSRMLLPLSITGIYQHQNDWNIYNGSLEEMLAWCKKEVVTPPVEPPIEPPVEVNLSSIHDVNVSIGDRAWVLAIESDQVVKDKNYTATWMDGFNLPMGGMKIALEPDGDKILELGAEPTFEGRCKELASKGFPVGGRFTIDPGALLKVGFTAPAVEANILTKDKDGKLVVNQIAAAVIDSWHDGVWTIDSVFNSKGKWLPVSYILLHMMATDAYPAGAIIGNDWQNRVFVRVFDTIRYLIENEGAPDIPIILFCSDDKNAQLGKVWLEYYDNGEFAQSIHNRAGNLYLALAKKSLASTDTFIDFGFFTFASDPVINYIPDGFANRLLMYEFTSGNQKCKLVTDKVGVPTPISGALWCNPKAAMYDFLGVGETESPPVIPPETSGSSTSGSSTSGSSTSGSSINPTIIDSMLLRLAKIETYLKTIQKFE